MVEVKKKRSKDGINEPLKILMEAFMYKITATIEKEGGTPTNWTRYSIFPSGPLIGENVRSST